MPLRSNQFGILNLFNNHELFVLFGVPENDAFSLLHCNLEDKRRWKKTPIDFGKKKGDLSFSSFHRNAVASCLQHTEKQCHLVYLLAFHRDLSMDERCYCLGQLRIPIQSAASGENSSGMEIEELEFDEKSLGAVNEQVTLNLADSNYSGFLFAMNECEYVYVPYDFLTNDEAGIGIINRKKAASNSDNILNKWQYKNILLKQDNVAIIDDTARLDEQQQREQQFIEGIRGDMATGTGILAFQFCTAAYSEGAGPPLPYIGIVAQAKEEVVAESDEDMIRLQNQNGPPAYYEGTKSQYYIIIFDIQNLLFAIHRLQPDPVFGFPFHRNGAAQAAHESNFFLIGGLYTNTYLSPEERYRALDEIWQLDLEIFKWKKMENHKIPKAVFNASAVCSNTGSLFVFGGSRTTKKGEDVQGGGAPGLCEGCCRGQMSVYPRYFTPLIDDDIGEEKLAMALQEINIDGI